VDDVRWGARARAAAAFLDRWEALARVRIAQATRRLLDDAAEVAASRYRVGGGRQSDVLRARVEVARMEEEVIREEAMVDGALSRLAGVLDIPEDSAAAPPLLPTFPAEVPTRESLEAMALADRPLLVAGRAEVEAATADARLAGRERWPDLRLGVQYGERTTAVGTDRMGSLMLGASLPVWAGSRQLRMRDEAAAMHDMAVADLAERRAETRARVAEVHAALLASRRLAALYRTTVLPQAEAAAMSALSAYRAGDGGFLEVVEYRMTENRYRRELVALDAAQGRAWAELEMLTGRSLLTTDAAPPRDSGH
jgi:outer membrane protein, heavy metal efflux system